MKFKMRRKLIWKLYVWLYNREYFRLTVALHGPKCKDWCNGHQA